jgi:uncharacterized protein YbcI
MSESPKLAGGELNAALTSALVGIHSEYLGHGPKTASTFHHGNIVVTLMHGVLTNAEKALARTDRAHLVSNIRQLLHETMEADSRAAVERLTGRTVVACITGNNIDPDIATEVFVLDAPL